MENKREMIIRTNQLEVDRSPPITDRKTLIMWALEQYERPLTRYAHRLFGNAGALEAARDAVQHTFMKLCEQDLESIENRLAPWLYQVCRNRVIDQLRLKGSHTESWPEPLQVADNHLGPAEQVEQTEMAERLSVLIGQLSGAEREVIELWSQGFDHGQISEILNKKRETVRVALHRGLQRLKQHPEVTKWLERATCHLSRPKSGVKSKAKLAQKKTTQNNLKPR